MLAIRGEQDKGHNKKATRACSLAHLVFAFFAHSARRANHLICGQTIAMLMDAANRGRASNIAPNVWWQREDGGAGERRRLMTAMEALPEQK